MDTRTETMQPCTIAYMRRTGAYGIECKAVMEQLKLWAKQTNNLNDDSIRHRPRQSRSNCTRKLSL